MFKRIYPDKSYNLPVSDFKFNHPSLPEDSHLKDKDMLTTERRRKLHGLMDQTMPKAQDINGKRVILIDYTDSGDSLVTAKTQLNDYYQGKQNIETTAFVGDYQGSDVDRIIRNFPGQKFHKVSVRREMDQYFFHSTLREYSLYDPVKIDSEKSSSTVKPRLKFQPLFEEVSEVIEKDQAFMTLVRDIIMRDKDIRTELEGMIRPGLGEESYQAKAMGALQKPKVRYTSITDRIMSKLSETENAMVDSIRAKLRLPAACPIGI